MARMTLFRLVLVALAAVIAVVTAIAIDRAGLWAAVATFAGDLDDPWRAQFYADLEIHLVLVACWILYRERARPAAFVFAAAAIVLGALFTVPYVLAATFRARGDVRLLLTGRV
jgi:hypothetical protein